MKEYIAKSSDVWYKLQEKTLSMYNCVRIPI